MGNGQWGIPQLRNKFEEVIVKQTNFAVFIVEYNFDVIGQRKMKVSGRLLSDGLKLEPMVLMQIENIAQTPPSNGLKSREQGDIKNEKFRRWQYKR
jgi:hypothetical protein